MRCGIAVAAVILLAAGGDMSAQEPGTEAEPQRGSVNDFEPGDGPEIEAVRFPGRSSLEHDLLSEAIVTRPSSCRSLLFYPVCLAGDWEWAEQKRFLGDAEVEEDSERLALLYETWGFPDANVRGRVLPDPEGDGDVVVEFQVREGDPILLRSLELEGLDVLDPPVQLSSPLPLSEGEPYSLPLLDMALEQIRAAFIDRGYPYAEVEVTGSVDEGERDAALVLSVRPGPLARFGEIDLRIEPPLDPEVVRERLAFAAGDPYRPVLIERSQESLYSLGIVEMVVVEPVGLLEREEVIRPRVVVATRDPRGVEVEGTVSSTECLEVAAFLTHRHPFGAPRELSVGGSVSNLLASTLDGEFPCNSTGRGEYARTNYIAEAELYQPWPGSPRTTLTARLFASRETAPGVYVQSGYGGEVGIGRELGAGRFASISYAPQWNDLEAAGLYYCGNYGVCDDAGVRSLSEGRWLAPVEALGMWRSDGPLYDPSPAADPPGVEPRAGPWRTRIRLGLEGAGRLTGSGTEYGRAMAEGVAVRDIRPRVELASRIHFGAMDGSGFLPPQLRLYSGGVSSVRGTGQNLLGPKVLVTDRANLEALGCTSAESGCVEESLLDPDHFTVRPTGGDLAIEANVEGRLWMSDRIQLAAFLDYGVLAAGDRPGSGLDFAGENALLSPGVGVRVITSLGPIRIDVAYDGSGPRSYPLLTADAEGGGFVSLGEVVYDPFTHDDPGFFGSFLRRLQVHAAIGQPF